MPSPDITPYLDLTINDKSPQDLYNAAQASLLTTLPTWIPREGNTEVLLLETLGLEVAESVFAINRLPDGIVEVLLKLFSITRDSGAAPVFNLTFNLATTSGQTIPAGASTRLNLPGGAPSIIFTTNSQLVIPPGSSSGTVLATGSQFTDAANSVAPGTTLDYLDAITYVDSVTLQAVTTNGRPPESDSAYFTRAMTRFARLNDTLVLPKHFTAYVLADPRFLRAFAIDNWTPSTIPTPVISSVTTSTAGGTLAAGTYGYRVSALNAAGETLASTEVTVVTTGTTSSNTVNWTAPVVPSGVGAITNYKVYGRTSGAELLIATVGSGTLTYLDTGSVTPSGALPAANTTGPAVGSVGGHVTVAVYGNNALSSSSDKTDIQTQMQTFALANLVIHIIDPTITTVPVTVTVHALTGQDPVALQSAITAALQNYLNPMTWSWSGTVRRNELIALISNVAGVDYVTTLTAPAADVVLTGNAPLASAGTLSITVA